MPEVIEIKKYSDFLRKILKNKFISDITIKKGRYKTHKPFPLYNKIKKLLPLKVIDIKTKGKFLYFILENDYYIFSTLGLHGGWTYCKTPTNKFIFPKLLDYINNNRLQQYKKTALNNLNVEFKIKSSNSNSIKLYYYDSLSFGTLKVVNNKKDLEIKLKSIGPDILDKDTTFDVFLHQINKIKNKQKEKAIGLILMNQKIISGIGNYLRSDILWLSKISPFRKICDLSIKELSLIYKNARLLTWGDYNRPKAIKYNIIKKSDKLPKDYNRNFFIYNSKEDIYGNEVVKEELYNGSHKRFIYWIPKRQK